MTLRVAYMATPTFGTVFSGRTHYLFSLLSGWNDPTISLDLYGTKIKPLNLNSGDRSYLLPKDTFWSEPERLTRKGRILWSLKTLQLLIARRNDYDIVNFQALNWGSLISPLILRPLGKKTVFTMSLYGNDNPGYILQQPRGKLQVSLMRRFDGAIALSPALVHDAQEHVIPNVICLRNFLAIPELERYKEKALSAEDKRQAKEKIGVDPTDRVFLFIGAIIYRKGVDTLIETFIDLSKRYSNICLVLIGPKSKQDSTGIDENFVNQLQKKVMLSGLSKKVKWTGLIREQTALVEYYMAADIFVFPTRNEGSPNVLAEAMAAGLPVVTSLLPGITDGVVADGKSGYLVSPNSKEGFVSAIELLLKDSDKIIEMGEVGRKLAFEKFGFESHCHNLKDFYLSLFSTDKNL